MDMEMDVITGHPKRITNDLETKLGILWNYKTLELKEKVWIMELPIPRLLIDLWDLKQTNWINLFPKQKALSELNKYKDDYIYNT